MRLWIPEFNGLIRYLADIERTVPGDGVGPLELDSIVTPRAIGVPKVRTARKMNWNWRVGRGGKAGRRTRIFGGVLAQGSQASINSTESVALPGYFLVALAIAGNLTTVVQTAKNYVHEKIKHSRNLVTSGDRLRRRCCRI